MSLASGKNGKAHVLEISNRANIQTLTTDAVVTLTDRIANHESSLNTNAHQISNIFGLQTELNSKANIFTGYTGSIDVIISIDFATQSVTKKTLHITNGIIESII